MVVRRASRYARPVVPSLRPVLRSLRHSGKMLLVSGLTLGLTAAPLPEGRLEGLYPSVQDPGKAQIGTEFPVNTYITNNQTNPSVAMDQDGDFVVVWMSNGQDDSIWGIYGQRYNSAGTTIGSEFQVNSYTTSSQRFPSVAMDQDGDFVVVWQSNGQDGSNYGIFGQRYNSAGSIVGSEFQINTHTTSFQLNPSVAMDQDGDFVVVWQSLDQEGSGTGIYGQRYNSAGSMVGTEFQVNSHTTNNQLTPSVAMDAAGDFTVVWYSSGQDGSGYGIYGQRFNSAGSMVGTEFQVNSHTTNNQLAPSVAMDASGDFTVVWHSSGQDGSGYGIYGQRFNSAGSMVGTEFQVNAHTTNNQDNPAVAMDADGDFTVVWASYDQDGSLDGVFGQHFDANPTAATGPAFKTLMSDIPVNNTTAGDQLRAAVAVSATGNYVIAFESLDADGTGINAVRGLGSLGATVVDLKVLLHGALSTVSKSEIQASKQGGPMRTNLQGAGLIPHGQPYNTAPWNYAGTESVAAFDPDVVDWILVHINAAGVNIATRAGLLLSDGRITDIDGVSKLAFPGVAAGFYFVVIEHRNHLSIASATALDLNQNSALYDFTTAVTQALGGDLYDAGGVFAMYGGDATADDQVVYIGANRDQLPIINELGTDNLADISGGYTLADMNLDGLVRYIGGGRDQKVIIETLGTANLADIKASNVP